MPRPQPPSHDPSDETLEKMAITRRARGGAPGGHLRGRRPAHAGGAGALAALAPGRLASARGPTRLVELVPIAGAAARGAHRAGRGHRRARVRPRHRGTRRRASSGGIDSRARRSSCGPARTPSIPTTRRKASAAARAPSWTSTTRPARSTSCAAPRDSPSTRSDCCQLRPASPTRSARRSVPSPTGSSSTASTPTDRGAPVVTSAPAASAAG